MDSVGNPGVIGSSPKRGKIMGRAQPDGYFQSLSRMTWSNVGDSPKYPLVI